jgi:Domain of unknown function (DUF6379)
MTLQARVIGDDALRVVEDGFELDIDLNWYRSLPLSCVATLELTVDGEEIPSDEITFNGYSLAELAERWDEYWFVLDQATIRVRRPLTPVDVHLRLGVRIPYLPIGPAQAVVYISEVDRRMAVAYTHPNPNTDSTLGG